VIDTPLGERLETENQVDRLEGFNPRPREGGDYIYPAINDRRKVKVVVEVNVTVKKLKMIVNSVNTVFKIGMSALLDRRRYEKIR